MSKFVYKDVSVPEELRGIIQHMPGVERYREELSHLGSQWDLLTILGQMSGTGTDMTRTREGFQNLTSELLGQLGLETLKKTSQDISAKAQVVVDIVIRNLFERTADIGFLATDDDIRAVLRRVEELGDGGARTPEGRALVDKLVDRFREYVAKYSVYFDIILMNTRGDVLCRMDPSVPVAHSDDPLITKALTTGDDYVEVFRESDLLPDAGPSLIYAYRVTETDRPGSRALGVLALCFRFQNEMEGVFNKLSGEDDWAVLTLLDEEGRVIASSDQDQVRIGSRMQLALGEGEHVVRFAGRQYLAKTCRTTGYEGFFGLGWMGHVMLPLEHAFENAAATGDMKQRVEEKVLGAVMNDPRLFSSQLRSIPVQADRIQGELERTVWNGNVREKDSRSKVLLWNISDAGARTKSIFEKSIGNLHETVVSAILDDVEFQAALAVDIMDRNLYERANDCRWWALTSAFRRILASPAKTEADLREITGILQYINGLYTVYTNLFVYDGSGTILAVSDQAQAELVGSSLDDAWVGQTLSIRDSQSYSVSPFEATDLYGGRHTYIYGASITELGSSRKVLGGIGIVFDSEPQFAAMLADCLPRDHSGRLSAGCFGMFADRERRIISSTDAAYRPGEILDIPEEFFSLDRGEKYARIIAHQGQYFAVGACTSSGYREYKVEDEYVNDVVGLVFVPLADATEHAATARRKQMDMHAVHADTGMKEGVELATFYVGNRWLGLVASRVVEAVPYQGVTDMPDVPDAIRGKMLYWDEVIPVVEIHTLCGQPYPEDSPAMQVVITSYSDGRGDPQRVGLVVDSLGQIPKIDAGRMDKAHSLFDSNDYTECIVRPEAENDDGEMLVVINPEGLMHELVEGCPAA